MTSTIRPGPFDLSGRVAVITGAGRGIGRAIAKVFAEAGARVVIVTRGEEAGRHSRDLIISNGGQASLICADIGNHADCSTAIARAASEEGGIDILIHNAGIFPQIDIEGITEPQLQEVMSVNLMSAFWLTQAALPHLRRAASPRLLFTSSVTGPRVALPRLAHYAASKSGLNGFIRAAAIELAKDAITVNGVEPGLIATEAISELGDDAEAHEMARAIPLKRLGDPKDIGYAMLYLASDEAAFITGQTIVVDGGALIPENSVLMP